jgi:iron complex transport system ATP-binding protein
MIAVEGLSVRRSGKEILHIEALRLPSVGAIALIGPNGSGKSTLLKVLAGIEQGQHGQVLLHNKRLSAYAGAERARSIGFIPQSFTPCWNQRVDELIALAANRTQWPAQSASKAYAHFELDELSGKRWDVLSGGERARVLSAMALTGEPPMLLADEPGAALDIRHRLQLVENLVQRGKASLVIICLHELDMAFRYFSDVILLDQGKLSFNGRAQDLLHQRLLDRTFGVEFTRISTDDGIVLHPRRIDGRP